MKICNEIVGERTFDFEESSRTCSRIKEIVQEFFKRLVFKPIPRCLSFRMPLRQQSSKREGCLEAS